MTKVSKWELKVQKLKDKENSPTSTKSPETFLSSVRGFGVVFHFFPSTSSRSSPEPGPMTSRTSSSRGHHHHLHQFGHVQEEEEERKDLSSEQSTVVICWLGTKAELAAATECPTQQTVSGQQRPPPVLQCNSSHGGAHFRVGGGRTLKLPAAAVAAAAAEQVTNSFDNNSKFWSYLTQSLVKSLPLPPPPFISLSAGHNYQALNQPPPQ